MPPTQDSQVDPTAAVVPPVRPAAPWRVSSVEARHGAVLHVTFADGTSGEVRMVAFLEKPAIQGTVFEALRDPSAFAQVRLSSLGAVEWPSGAELAPDAMYDGIRTHGAWVVD